MTVRRIAWIEPARLPWGVSDTNIYSGILFPRAGPKMAGLLQGLGYQVEIISGELSPIDADEIAANFDLACISVISNTAPQGYVLSRWLGDRGLPVVLGGYQFAHQGLEPSCFVTTEEALAFAPLVIRGEGYQAMVQLLAALQGQGELSAVGGLSYRDETGRVIHNANGLLLSREEMQALPPADWAAIRDRERIRVAAVHGMCGCPRHCSWCAVWPRDGRRNRNSMPQAFVDELQSVLASGNYIHTFFSADNFPVYRDWAKEVCAEMLKRDVKMTWTCQAEVGAVRDQDLLQAMVDAGCKRWCIGLESINPAALADSNKKQDLADMERCIERLHEHGIQVHGMFIVGLPFDTEDTVRATVAWAKKSGIDTVQFLCLCDLPGSTDYENGLAERSFRPFDGPYEPLNWLFVNGHYARLPNDEMNLSQVQESCSEAMLRFYSLARWVRPLFSFNLPAYRASRRAGQSRLASLKSAWLYDLFVAALRFRGWLHWRQWLRAPLNRAYRKLLSATGQEAARIRQQMVDELLPTEWMPALEAAWRERQAWPALEPQRPAARWLGEEEAAAALRAEPPAA